MKQVRRTDDGAFFDNLEDAQDWEHTQYAVKDLATFIVRENIRLDDDDGRELAAQILAHYNVSKK